MTTSNSVLASPVLKTELYELLRRANALRPDLRYVMVETFCGDLCPAQKYWAHTDYVAFVGDSPEEMLNDIRNSVTKAEAA